MLVRHEDGRFQWSELWSGHNHSRPLTLRALFLVNALLDRMGRALRVLLRVCGDLRGLRARGGLRCGRRRRRGHDAELALLAVLSLLAFSPGRPPEPLVVDDAAARPSRHVFKSIGSCCGAFFLGRRSRRASPAANIICACSARPRAGSRPYTLTNGLVAFRDPRRALAHINAA
jgi:hypothetical protein